MVCQCRVCLKDYSERNFEWTGTHMRITSFHRSITSITNSFTRKPRVFKLIKLKRAWERNDPIKYWHFYPSPPTLFARFLFLFVCPPVQINSKKGKNIPCFILWTQFLYFNSNRFYQRLSASTHLHFSRT